MKAVFLSKAEVYNGNYYIKKYERSHEFSSDMHYHDFYEIQFYLCEAADGQIGTIVTNGHPYPLTHGCITLINMFDIHQIRMTCRAPYTRFCIAFDSSLLLFACSGRSNLFNIFSCYAKADNPPRPLTPSQIATFVDIYTRYEHLDLTHGGDIMEKALILEIFANVYDIFYEGQQVTPSDSRNLTTITELIDYIHFNMAGDLSLQHLAKHFNFSTYHLSRMFKRYTGTTLNHYIITKRIDKSKLLLKTSMSIADISKEVGFNNYNHFYRTFKNFTGVNPTDYRAENDV